MTCGHCVAVGEHATLYVCMCVYSDFLHIFYLFYFLLIVFACGLVVRVPGYRSRGPGSIPGATRFSEK
jgi:hypothetical protein